MSTASQDQKQAVAVQKNDKAVEYIPLGGTASVSLTVNLVRNFLCTPTKNGNWPTDEDIMKFIMLCKARELDPWVNDAFLVGYDTKAGPQFNLITAAQALLKRAEVNPHYDGMESGVIIEREDKIVEFRQGDMVFNGELLIGGWCKAFRKDQSRPSYDALRLDTYSTGLSRWEKDPAGMIVKCAEASALRKAFPTQLGGLYSREEMEHLSQGRIENRESGTMAPALRSASSLDQLAERIEQAPRVPTETKQIVNEPQAARACEEGRRREHRTRRR